MAVNGDRRAARAVGSVRAQDVPVEIVVVNSGDRSVEDALGDHLEHIVLVEEDRRRLPGGTRNLGVRHSRAPIVAFLAADCVAAAGWARRRIAQHAAGNPAVGSALRPLSDDQGRISTAAWASYALLHATRAPEWPAELTSRYGASYARSVFADGLFREDLRMGEDTEFHARVADGAVPVWTPDVLTFHEYPGTIAQAARETYGRGRILAGFAPSRSKRPFLSSLRRIYTNGWTAARLTRRVQGDAGRALRRARPAIVLLAATYAAGLVVGSLGGNRP